MEKQWERKMCGLYVVIDMGNGLVAYDRLTLQEAIDKLPEGHYSLMPMEDKHDNPAYYCGFCGRQSFALKERD